MIVVAIHGHADGAAGHDLRRAGDDVPERHLFPHVPLVGVRGIVSHDRRVIVAIDVDRRRIGHERVGLLGYLERRDETAFGSAEADDPCRPVLRRKRQEEMAVDGDLRAFLGQEVER